MITGVSKHRFTKSHARRTTRRRRPALGRRVARLVKSVRALKPEVKWFELDTNAIITYTGVTTEFATNIAQNVTEAGRIGSSVKVKSLKLNYTVAGNSGAANFFQSLRVLVVRGIAEEGVALTLPNVLLVTGSSIAPLSFYNKDQQAKFKVLYDKTHIVGSGMTTYGTGSPVNPCPGFAPISKRISVSIKNHETQFSANSTTVYNGGIYLMLISDIVTNGPSFTGAIRLLYTDT